MRPLEFISLEQNHQNSVYFVNCIWEFFVLVCEDARSDRKAIKLALDSAMVSWLLFASIVVSRSIHSQRLSKEVASKRPYAPPVHVVILPSQIPLDLLLNIRDFDEAWLVRLHRSTLS